MDKENNAPSAKAPKLPKLKKIKNEENDGPKKPRGKYFTVPETDFLLSLVLASDITSQVTNKITPYGRLRTWEDIERIYNSSPIVKNVSSLFVCFCVRSWKRN